MDLIEAEIVGDEKKPKSKFPFGLIVAIIVLFGSLYGSFKLGQATVDPVVKVKKVAVNQDGKQWFTINERYLLTIFCFLFSILKSADAPSRGKTSMYTPS
jgi:hypothetical protein